ANAGGNGFGDYFVSKINATGSALIFSTYLGGTDGEGYFGDGYDAAYSGAIAVDAEGGIYVTGATISSDFPTTPNALQPTRSAKGADCGATCPSAFVSKFSSAGA